MKRIIVFVLLLALLNHPTIGQAPFQAASQNLSFGKSFESGDWLYVDQGIRVNATSFFEDFGGELGLGVADRMQLVNTKMDQIDWKHFQFQQLHHGIPVEFAIYNVHEKDERVVKSNGVIIPDIEVNTTIGISEEIARELAIECIGAAAYYWENPRLEKLKKHATDDPDATFYPRGELLIADNDFNPVTHDDYRLAWKFEIHADDPHGRDWIYVDARSGEIIKELDLDMHNFQGTAETRYSGVQDIITDTSGGGYILRDMTRGMGIETYNAMDSSDMQYAIDFVDDDNHWDHANDRADDAATDAHWATEQMYDYLLNRHGINSYNDQGSKIISYIHVRQNWRNARWTGFWSEFGDAGGEPWTFVDVVAHEFGHGFTRANAALIYSRESGALNESFSDIIGEAVQRHVSGEADWYATPSPLDTIRDYIDPNQFEQPDTYFGDFWRVESGDNYGVHSNSAVQNHWFYLLCEGGAATNDHGAAYQVASIGFEAAIDIALRNARYYLTPSSGYHDARQGSLFAAEDLFGSCSFEYMQVANAWHAVGVGEAVGTEDFTILNVGGYELCNIGDEEFVTITIKHLGCDTTGPLTLDLKLQKTNALVIQNEQVEFVTGIAPGETFEYTFTQPFDFSRHGAHELTAEVTAANDLNDGNNSSPARTAYNLAPVTRHAFRFYTNIAPRTFRDSLAFLTGEFADLAVAFNAGRDNTAGIRIEGEQSRNALPILPGEDVFDKNERIGAWVCACVDGAGLDSLGLQFDLRQTYSDAFAEQIGMVQPRTSAMRVLVDDIELQRFYPLTNRDDKWQRRNIDLSAWVGQQMTVCFETRTIQSQTADRDHIGDRVFLDNIEVIGVETPLAVKQASNVEPLAIYPNPTSGNIIVNFALETTESLQVMVMDLTGHCIHSEKIAAVQGTNQVSLDLSDQVAGVYAIMISTDTKTFAGRVALH